MAKLHYIIHTMDRMDESFDKGEVDVELYEEGLNAIEEGEEVYEDFYDSADKHSNLWDAINSAAFDMEDGVEVMRSGNVAFRSEDSNVGIGRTKEEAALRFVDAMSGDCY